MARRFALVGAVVAASASFARVSTAAAIDSDVCTFLPLHTLSFACGDLCDANASCILQNTNDSSSCSAPTAGEEGIKVCRTAPSGSCRAVCFALQPANTDTFKFYITFSGSADQSSSKPSDGSGSSMVQIPDIRVEGTIGDVPSESNAYVRRIGELLLPPNVTNVVISGGRTEEGTRGFVAALEFDANVFRNATHVTSVSLLNIALDGRTTSNFAALLPSNLTSLNLRNTKLQQLPLPLTTLTALETLKLDMNDLANIPSTLNLPKLQTLKLSDNQLTAFAASLPSLQSLDLSKNLLDVFPYDMFTSTTLRSLDVTNNPSMKAVVFSESQFAKISALEIFLIDTAVLDTSSCSPSQVKQLLTTGASVCVLSDELWTTFNNPSGSRSHSKTILIVSLVAAVTVVGLAVGGYVLWRKKRNVQTKTPPTKSSTHSRTAESASGIFERLDDSPDATDLAAARQERDSEVVAHPDYTFTKDPALHAHRLQHTLIDDVRVIGSGAFVLVWLVVYTPTKRRLASKRLLHDYANRQKLVAFVLEAKLHMTLVHPSIVELVGVAWTTELDLQVLFEYMPNGDLRSHVAALDPHLTPWGYAKLRIAIDIVEALVYVHSFAPPLVHRDLTSRNVLLADDLTAKVCDFGVARFVSENDTMTSGVGSGKWLAPEILAGSTHYNAACDIYAFGVLLSELDTHHVPYDDLVDPHGHKLSEAAVLEMVARGHVQPTLRASCPEEIREIMRQCLAFDAGDRPSAIGVAYGLRRLRNDWLKHKKLFRTHRV